LRFAIFAPLKPGIDIALPEMMIFPAADRCQNMDKLQRKSEEMAHKLIIIEEECPKIPRRGWAEMIWKVYEVSPLVCPKCLGQMRIIAFLTDYSVVDRIINHLKLVFVASKPPPPLIAYQEVLMAAETSAEYFL
jgi:hypothetical protein